MRYLGSWIRCHDDSEEWIKFASYMAENFMKDDFNSVNDRIHKLCEPHGVVMLHEESLNPQFYVVDEDRFLLWMIHRQV